MTTWTTSLRLKEHKDYCAIVAQSEHAANQLTHTTTNVSLAIGHAYARDNNVLRHSQCKSKCTCMLEHSDVMRLKQIGKDSLGLH